MQPRLHERKEAALGLPPTNYGLGLVHSLSLDFLNSTLGIKYPAGREGEKAERKINLRELMRNLPHPQP